MRFSKRQKIIATMVWGQQHTLQQMQIIIIIRIYKSILLPDIGYPERVAPWGWFDPFSVWVEPLPRGPHGTVKIGGDAPWFQDHCIPDKRSDMKKQMVYRKWLNGHEKGTQFTVGFPRAEGSHWPGDRRCPSDTKPRGCLGKVSRDPLVMSEGLCQDLIWRQLGKVLMDRNPDVCSCSGIKSRKIILLYKVEWQGQGIKGQAWRGLGFWV